MTKILLLMRIPAEAFERRDVDIEISEEVIKVVGGRYRIC